MSLWVWLDFETTGLIEDHPAVLEAAWIFTDDEMRQLTPLRQRLTAIPWPASRREFDDLDGSVLDLVNGHVMAMLAAIPRDGKRQDQDMRREIVLREINQGALAGMSSAITNQAADAVLAALDRYDEWALEQRGVGRVPPQPEEQQ